MALHTILRNPNGNRYVLYLYWDDDRWNWGYNWLGNDLNARNPSAVLANLFISLLPYYFGRRVLFHLTCTFQMYILSVYDKNYKFYCFAQSF